MLNIDEISEDREKRSYRMRLLKYFAAFTMILAAIFLALAILNDKIRIIYKPLPLVNTDTKSSTDDHPKITFTEYQGFNSSTFDNSFLSANHKIHTGDLKTMGTCWIILCVLALICLIIGTFDAFSRKPDCDNEAYARYLAAYPLLSSFFLSIACIIMMRHKCSSESTMKYGPSMIIAMVDSIILFAVGMLLCIGN